MTMPVLVGGDRALNSARFGVGTVRKFVTQVAAVTAVVTAATLGPAAAASAAPSTPGAPSAPSAPAAPTAKAAPAVSPAAGMSIGDAGVITSSGSSSIVTGSDDWWVVYPSSAGATVTFTVADNAASNASCAGIWAGLYDTTGTGQRITTVALNPGTSGQLSGRQAGS